jgi:hypothetical protein
MAQEHELQGIAMADDKLEIVGRWRVAFGPYRWEYVFAGDGTVRWTDPLNNESGSGRWSMTSKTIYLSWSKSSTKETWNRPIKRKEQTGWIEASYRTGPFSAEKMEGIVLPTAQGATEIDLELDPVSGEYVQTDPRTNSRYIERVFTAVAYGIIPDGYYVYCEGMDLPILMPESMVDFRLASAERERSRIFDTFAEAKSAAGDGTGRRRIAYFWGAGGAVVAPTIVGPATTPELYSTIIAVRSLRDKFVSVMLPAITLAIGMISGPTPMTIKGNQNSGRVAKRRGGNEPARDNPQMKVVPIPGRPRAGRQQLQEIVSNPMDHLTFRTRDPAVASSKSLSFTGETNRMAPEGIYVCRGTGNKGYGPYGVTVKVSKVAVRTVPGKADEFVIQSPIEASDGVWWHESDLAGIKK